MTDTLARLSTALSDRYLLERELGAGGMATVYLAHDVKHDRDVAIKVLHPDLGAALGGERFLTEIRTTAKLQHPHILPLLDSGEANGLLYYVMPYVTGETLRARLTRERQLPIGDAVLIAREVADALGSAHAIGIIHRDIKPENILLQGGHALVADFGIALAVQSAGGQRMTQTGLSLGTPQYMSPEQAMGERAIDARSDVYALGAVTYEMLIGEPPFTGPSVQAIVARLLTDEPRPMAGQRKAIPEHVEAAVMRALEKLPADRFAQASEFATALATDAGRSTDVPAHRRGRPTPASGRTEHRPGRIALWLALLAAGVAAGWIAARTTRQGESAADQLTVTSLLAAPGGSFGEARSLALSPDGRRLAFVFAAADGSRMLWLRYLDRLTAEPIPHTSRADAPFWSPDGRSLGYFADGHLTVVDGSGEPRRLCPVSDPTGGSWSTKGIILFGHREGLSTVPAAGGTCRLIVSRDSASALKGVFLPDGERFLFSRGRTLDMAAANLDGRLLGTIPIRVVEFALVAPGYLIVPSLTDVGGVDAQRIDLRTLKLEGPITRLASDVRSRGGVHTFAVSSNGAFTFLPGSVDRPYLEFDASGVLRDTIRVEGTWTLSVRPARAGAPLVAVGGNTVGLWLYDLDAGRGTRLLTTDSTFPTPIGGLGTTWPVFNGDGSHLVYAMTGPSRCRIVDRDLTTEVTRVVVEETHPNNNECPVPLDWSPDGQHLLVRRDTVLQILPVDRSAASVKIVRPGRLWEGHFSPDGHSVAYSSDETGRAEVYLQHLPSGPPVRVSLEGGRWPAWSKAGRQLYFVTPDGRVQEVALASGAGGAAATLRTRFSIPSWRRSMFDDLGTGFAVVGDGQRFLVRVSPTGLAVAYVQHWRTLLRRADSASAAERL